MATDSHRHYRKKPVVIEAVQWFKMGDHPAVGMVKDYLANGGRGEESPGIDTLEGKLRVSPGDWIIKGAHGEFYPCKPDIFAATYEPASAASEKGPISPKAINADYGSQPCVAAPIIPCRCSTERDKQLCPNKERCVEVRPL